jgi:hypothetical protein
MMSRKHRVSKPVAAKRSSSSGRDGFTRVMRQLEAAGGTCPHPDPIMERLRQCPEAFTAGEMVGKMFDALKYGEADSAGHEPYLPPAGVVIPLV